LLKLFCKKFDLIGGDKLGQHQNYNSLTCIKSSVMTMEMIDKHQLLTSYWKS